MLENKILFIKIISGLIISFFISCTNIFAAKVVIYNNAPFLTSTSSSKCQCSIGSTVLPKFENKQFVEAEIPAGTYKIECNYDGFLVDDPNLTIYIKKDDIWIELEGNVMMFNKLKRVFELPKNFYIDYNRP